MTFETLTSKQMAKADKTAIDGGTAGYDLMKKAGSAVVLTVKEHYAGRKAVILCGPGNNGGDGFVVAKLLHEEGWDVAVYSLTPADTFKGDAAKAAAEWDGSTLSFDDFNIDGDCVIIDAVFGTGLSKPLTQLVIDVFEKIKAAGVPVLAVDIPSGVNGDDGTADPHTLKAEHTVTFFRKKTGHMLMPGMGYCGLVSVQDIGIANDVLSVSGFDAYENDPALWGDKLPVSDESTHKYKKGHLAVLGGTRLTGAARMASEAAMRTGAGLCTIIAEKEAGEIYRCGAPHVMVEELENVKAFAGHLVDERRNAVLMGPGAGQDDKEGLQGAVLDVLALSRSTLLDADALTCFADNPLVLFKAMHEQTVITPHEGEFKKLFPDLKGSKLDKVRAAGDLVSAVIVLKGPDTVVYKKGIPPTINNHAEQWLATGGSGDVLAGIIAALMAQGMDAFDAACAGVWVHGDASVGGGPGMVAPDIIERIPAILKKIT